MNTPEQIAEEAVARIKENTVSSQRSHDEVYVGMIGAIAAAIKADRAQRDEPVVVIRDGCVYEGIGVDVIDLDFLSFGAVTHQSDFSQEDIDRMLEKLTQAGLPSAADDVREWWADR